MMRAMMRFFLLAVACGALNAATFSGIVVDENGRPVSGVTIAYVSRENLITDAGGHFSVHLRPRSRVPQAWI